MLKLVFWVLAAAQAATAGWLIDGVAPGGDGSVTVEYGTTAGTAYRGDWGAAVSNLAAGAVQTNDARYLAALTNAGAFVPVERTITINGVVKSLEADVEFTVEGGGGNGGTNGTAGTPGRLLYVDAFRSDSYTPDGSVLRPFTGVQAAMDAIGSAADTNEYLDPYQQFFRVLVAPGRYTGDVHVAFRPYVSLDLSAAVIEGNLVYEIPPWGGIGTMIYTPTLIIRGDSLRSAYQTASETHPVTGVDGDIIGRVDGEHPPQPWSRFHCLHIIHAGVSGAIRYEGGNGLVPWGHLFLERAQVRDVVSTNGWGGVTVYAHNWSGGHVGGGPTGSGLGPLVGKVLPYNLQNLLISGGMRLEALIVPFTSIWHNVTFETGDYDVTNVQHNVTLDTSSYRSWKAATSPEDRGAWTLGDRMELSDAPLGLTTNVSVSGVTLRFIDGVFDGVEP